MLRERISLVIGSVFGILGIFLVILSALAILGWYISDYNYEALQVLLGGLASIALGIASMLKSPYFNKIRIIERWSNYQSLRIRQLILRKIMQEWILPVLQKPIPGTKAIDLQLALKSIKSQSVTAYSTVASHVTIADIFDDANGQLILIGETGSGKTRKLCELAKELVSRAEQNKDHPIPIVLSLTTWSKTFKSFANWIIYELSTERYQLDEATISRLINNKDLLPILDDLDKVPRAERHQCIREIKNFLKHTGISEIVVCSGIDYESDDLLLPISTIVCLLPLSYRNQIDYLNASGLDLQAVKRTLELDPEMVEFTRTPLVLNALIRAYQGLPIQTLQSLKTSIDRRRYLVQSFLERMYADFGIYHSVQVRWWLTWIALQLQNDANGNILYIEKLDPKQIPIQFSKIYLSICDTVISLTSIIYFMSILLRGPLYTGVVTSREASFIFMFINFGLIGATLLMLRRIWKFKNNLYNIELYETISLSWFYVIGNLVLITPLGIAFGVIGFGSTSLGIAMGIIGAIVRSLVGGFIWGIKRQDLSVRLRPNIGVRKSFFIGLSMGLLVGLLRAIAETSKVNNVLGAIISGFGYAWIFGLGFGLFGVLQHYLVRWLLAKAGCLPFSYAKFLDLAVEKGLLRTIGGGYRFTHNILRDHLVNEYRLLEQPLVEYAARP